MVPLNFPRKFAHQMTRTNGTPLSLVLWRQLPSQLFVKALSSIMPPLPPAYQPQSAILRKSWNSENYFSPIQSPGGWGSSSLTKLRLPSISLWKH